ncbi:signal peptidase I [Gordonia sihwensis]|uniref:signal peptidase I n=2 Tax=Gordonia TaxID=2053 RepID=UPI0024175297|nr:signal peptidase I [Gordonia sihwensis]WFN92446.1 signal peptidase I [Gordonia sihwensis]
MSQQEARTTQRRRRRELALNLGAVAGLVCIVIAVVSMTFGIKPLVFRSGSMSPQIPTGSLAVARTVPAAQISVGDVVSVDNEAGTRITHRVVAVDPAGGDKVALIMKGDANRVADPTPYLVDHADRVITSVPFAGYVAAWLSSKTAIFLGGVLAGALLMLAFGPLRRSSSDASNDAHQTETLDEPADSSEAKLQEANCG